MFTCLQHTQTHSLIHSSSHNSPCYSNESESYVLCDSMQRFSVLHILNRPSEKEQLLFASLQLTQQKNICNVVSIKNNGQQLTVTRDQARSFTLYHFSSLTLTSCMHLIMTKHKFIQRHKVVTSEVVMRAMNV